MIGWHGEYFRFDDKCDHSALWNINFKWVQLTNHWYVIEEREDMEKILTTAMIITVIE